MEENEFKKIWQDYDLALERSTAINLQSWAMLAACRTEMQSIRVVSRMEKLSVFKRRAILLGILWVLLLVTLIYLTGSKNPFFSVSAGMIALISLISMGQYLHQLWHIASINLGMPVTQVQNQLVRLQLSTIRSVRTAWLQLPFYSTWFWSLHWIRTSPASFWAIAFPIALGFTWLTICLYRNIQIGHMDKKWVRRLMMTGPEYKTLEEAQDFLRQLQDFDQ